jgi:hypothetical protein
LHFKHAKSPSFHRHHSGFKVVEIPRTKSAAPTIPPNALGVSPSRIP